MDKWTIFTMMFIFLLLLGIGVFWSYTASEFASISLVEEKNTQCPNNEYGYNETSSGSFICSQVSYSQLSGTPIETSSQCPSGEYSYNETITGNLVCSAVSFSQLSGTANFQTQLSNFPSACPSNQFISGISATPTCNLVNQGYNSTGLVGYWPLTEGSGNYAYDLSGNGNVGTLVNSPAWLSGSSCKFSGACLNFTADGYLSISKQNPVTVNLWYLISNISISNEAIFEPGSSGPSYGLTWFKQGGYDWEVYFYNVATSSSFRFRIITPIQNTWTMATLVYFSSNESLSYYSDGIKQINEGYDYSPSVVEDSSLFFGSYPSVSQLNGVLSQIMFFNYALSSSQVKHFTIPFRIPSSRNFIVKW